MQKLHNLFKSRCSKIESKILILKSFGFREFNSSVWFDSGVQFSSPWAIPKGDGGQLSTILLQPQGTTAAKCTRREERAFNPSLSLVVVSVHGSGLSLSYPGHSSGDSSLQALSPEEVLPCSMYGTALTLTLFLHTVFPLASFAVLLTSTHNYSVSLSMKYIPCITHYENNLMGCKTLLF